MAGRSRDGDFYALSLLGTVRPGDSGYRRQALAASIAQKVFAENPKHPGAAHFIIHSFDDPDHAPLALSAANAYAKIAPAAAHALHMPSHIYVQLGMWQQTAASNVDAFKAAVDLNTRMKLAEGREDFHTLSWLAYSHLMLGRFDEAKKDVELAKQAADRNAGNRGVQNGYLGMRARYLLETAQWEKIPLDQPAPAAAGDAHANMPGMPGMAYADPGNAWIFIAGLSAAKMGDAKTAEAAETRLRAAREKTAATNAYAAKEVTVLEKEVGAAAKWAAGQKDEALRLAKEAADVELTTNAPSGPPDPMKPASELYGEMLLEAGAPGRTRRPSRKRSSGRRNARPRSRRWRVPRPSRAQHLSSEGRRSSRSRVWRLASRLGIVVVRRPELHGARRCPLRPPSRWSASTGRRSAARSRGSTSCTIGKVNPYRLRMPSSALTSVPPWNATTNGASPFLPALNASRRSSSFSDGADQ